jgi:hypothetical protein
MGKRRAERTESRDSLNYEPRDLKEEAMMAPRAAICASVWLLAVGCQGSGDTCGPGTHASGGTCLADPVPDSGPGLQCGQGTVLSNGYCLPLDAGAGLQCGAGTVLDNGACVAADAGPGVQCGAGTTLSNGICVSGLLPDGGFADTTTWVANVSVASGSFPWSGEPAVAVDSRGQIFVATMTWDFSSAGYGVALFKSTNGGQSFSEVASYAPPNNGFLGDTTVLVDGSDRVYWAHIQYGASASAATGQVEVVISPDGTTFPAAQRVDTASAQWPFCDRPWLSLAPDGSVYLEWTNGNAATYALGSRYAVSQGGQAFGPQQTFLDPTQSSAYVEILAESPLAFTDGGRPVATTTTFSYMAGAETSTVTVNSWLSSSSGWSESNVGTLFSDRSFVFTTYSIVASDSVGTLHCLYLDGDSHNLAPYLANSNDGKNWSSPSAVDGFMGHSEQAALPWVTTDAQDNVHVIWLDNRYGGWVPMTAYSADGVNFSTIERIGDAQFTQTGSYTTWIGDFLSMVVRDGWRYAVWTDSREGTSQVYFSKAPTK